MANLLLNNEETKTAIDQANQTQLSAVEQSKKDRAQMAKEGGVTSGIGSDGVKEMQVEAGSFHHWGQKKGYACWNDADFVKDYLRDVPEARVKFVPKKTSLNFSGIPKDRLDALFGPDDRMNRSKRKAS